jgi:hypothetical protein
MTQGGGLLQLVAIGKQDVFLTGNPSVSWFKQVYRRHTNFAIEAQQMYFDGSPNFGQKITCLVPRFGDLLGPLFLKVTLPQLYFSPSSFSPPKSGVKVGYVNSPGHALIQEISVQIGEQEIDKQTGQWMEIYSSLTTDASQQEGFRQMISQKPGYPFIDYGNNIPDLSGGTKTLPKATFSRQNGGVNVDVSGLNVDIDGNVFVHPTSKYPQTYDEPIMGPVTMYIPLRFWFNKNPGQYLPLLAMQYHPVRINLTLAPLQNMFYSKKLYDSETAGNVVCNAGLSVEPAQPDIQLYGDYVYLDVPERRTFVSSKLEYLIEQVQYSPPLAIPANSLNASLQLNFNHPIKEFIWVVQRNVMQNRHEYFNWSSLGFYEIQKADEQGNPEPGNRNDLIVDAKIQLDGQDRFAAREAPYFRLVQPYQRHTAIPADRFIYVYSLALRPEELQPSGTLNASRIDSIVLQLTIRPGEPNGTVSYGNMSAFVYVVNYNVLRVIDGYAGLLFSV